jgi:hypothetical protein
MRQLLAFTALLTATLGVAACGSEKSDTDQVRGTAQQLLDSDKAVCGKLTEKFSKATFGGSKEKCEKSAEKGDDSPKAKITKVAIKGDAATVIVKDKDGDNQVRLVKDGDWKIDQLVAAGGQTEEAQARAAVDAFLGAIRSNDAQTFCGLLSDRFARTVTGKAQFAIAKCVTQVKKSGLGSLEAKVGKASVRSVVPTTTKDKKTRAVTGRGAIISLSTGDVISVRKQGNRYVIENINGKG